MLAANRSEIAIRIFRAANELGLIDPKVLLAACGEDAAILTTICKKVKSHAK